MKKKLISLLLAFALLAAFTACSAETPQTQSTSSQTISSDVSADPSSSEPEEPGFSAELKLSGVGITLPVRFAGSKGILQLSGGVEIGPGLNFSDFKYYAMTQEKYDELIAKDRAGTITEEEVAWFMARNIDLLVFFTADGTKSESDVIAAAEQMTIPEKQIRKLGSVGDYTFYGALNPLASMIDFEKEIVFDEGYREEFDALLKILEEDSSVLRFFEPEASSSGAAAGSAVSFETTDLDGNSVRSEDLFKEHTLTMVNLWGTYCGPCIGEMPDLEQLNRKLESKNCAIIGIVIDVPSAQNAEMVSAAKEILSATGVTYPNLCVFNGLDSVFPAQFVPTSYFVDSDGRIVGETAIGARGAEDYEKLIDEILKTLS